MTTEYLVIGFAKVCLEDTIQKIAKMQIEQCQYFEEQKIKTFNSYNIYNTNIPKQHYNKQISKGNYFYRK